MIGRLKTENVIVVVVALLSMLFPAMLSRGTCAGQEGAVYRFPNKIEVWTSSSFGGFISEKRKNKSLIFPTKSSDVGESMASPLVKLVPGSIIDS